MFLLGFLFFFFEGLSAQTGGNIYDVSCYNKYDKGVTYNGTVSRGFFHDQQKTCINWKMNNSPFTTYYPDHNYCRNPRPDAFKAPWCYIGDNFQTGICNIPVCEITCKPFILDNNVHASIQPDLNKYVVNTRVTFSCIPGYTGSNTVAVCLANGHWSSQQTQICTPVNCKSLNLDSHVKSLIKLPKYNDLVTLSCEEGYVAKPLHIKCDTQGNWPLERPNCIATMCSMLLVDDKVIRSENISKYNDNVTLSCKEGYNGIPLILKCNANGVWPLQRPNCTAVPCPALSNTKHMKQLINHSGYHYGDIITFQCVNGYILSGPPFITCRSTRNHSIGYWSDQPPVCAAVTCQALRPVHHQKLEPDQIKYSYRDNVTFKCNDGYELTTEYIKTTCLSDGTWNNKQPNCTEKSLSYKDSMKNRGKGISYELFGGILAAIVSISAGLQIATCFYYRKQAGKSATVYEDMKFNTVERQITSNEDTYSELT